MADFSDYLSKPIGDMRRVLTPEGHYNAIWKTWDTKESAKGEPMLVITYELVSAGEDVDTTLLPEKGIQGKKLNAFYMLKEDFGQDDIRKSLEATGQQMDPAQSFGAYLDPAKGLPVTVYIKHGRRDKQDPNSELTENVNKVLPPQ